MTKSLSCIAINKLIKSNPDYHSEIWKEIVSSPNLSLKVIEKNSVVMFGRFYSIVSRHPKLSTVFIKKFKNKKWDITALEKHPNFSIEWVEILGKDNCWDWETVYKHPNFQPSWVKIVKSMWESF